MAFIHDCLAEERDEQDEQVREMLYKRFQDGKTDAAFGKLPEYTDATYLEGYVAGIKELPTAPETGKVQLYSPHKHFALNWVDGDPEYCDQFSEF